MVRDSFSDWGGAWSPHMWEFVRPLFAELKRLSEQRGFKVVVLGFPVRPQVESEGLYDYPQRRLAEMMEDLDMPLLDLLPLFRKEYRTATEELFYDRCHHTPQGNNIIAEKVYQFLDGHI